MSDDNGYQLWTLGQKLHKYNMIIVFSKSEHFSNFTGSTIKLWNGFYNKTHESRVEIMFIKYCYSTAFILNGTSMLEIQWTLK
jgi:hypothetical protein